MTIVSMVMFLSIGQAFAISVGDVAITTEATNTRNSIVIVKSITNGTATVKILNYPSNVANSNGEYQVSEESLIPTVKKIEVNGMTFKQGQIVKSKMFRRVNKGYILYTFANNSILVINADDSAGIELFKRDGTKAFEKDVYGLYLKNTFSSESQTWW